MSETRSELEINALRDLRLTAPTNTFVRFRRRAAVVQGTRMLFESQVIGFWVVLHAMLRMLFGAPPANAKSAANAVRGNEQ